jgi:hypothetical protein
MSKLGIILTGQMRTYDSERIMHSYQRFLSTYVPIDLFIFTWKNRGYSNNHGQPDLNNHQDYIISENDIISYYSQFKFITIKKIVIEDFDSFINSLPPNMKKLYHTPFRFHSITTTSIPIEYKYQQAIKYLEITFKEFLKNSINTNLEQAKIGGKLGTLQLITGFLRLNPSKYYSSFEIGRAHV